MAPKSLSEVPAPDGGWGWVIVAGCALQWTMWGGILRSFSLLHEQLRIRFNASASEAAVVYSLNVSLGMMFAPMAAALYAQFTARQVMALGASLVSAGVLLTGFAPSLFVVYITYGVIAGIGNGLISVVKPVMIALWFDKLLGRAMALSLLTDGLGGLMIPPLVAFCFNYYGYTGTFMILSALTLHGMITMLVLISPRPGDVRHRKKSLKEDHDQDKNKNSSFEDLENCIEKRCLQEECKLTNYKEVNDIGLETLMQHYKQNDVNEIEEISSGDDAKMKLGTNGLKELKIKKLQSDNSEAFQELPTLTVDKNEKQTAKTDTSKLKFANENGNVTHVAEVPEMEIQIKPERKENTPRSKFGSLARGFFSCLDLQLLRRSRYVTCCLYIASYSLMSAMVMTHFAGMAREQSMSIHQVAILLSTLGGVSILARLASGFLFDLPCFRSIRSLVFAVFGLGSGILLCITPHITDIVLFSLVWALNFVLFTIVSTQEPVILRDLVRNEKYASAIGFSRFLRGCAVLIGPTLGGYLKDVSGDYKNTFYLGGGAFAFTALLFEANLLRRQQRTAKLQHPDTV